MGGLKKCVAEAQNKRRVYKNEKQVNWDLVDTLLMSGCTGTEIASHFNLHHDTFFRKLEKEKGVAFTAYCQEKRSKGDSLIKHQQFLKALGKTNEGDNTMLVWLGKNRLNQKENPDQESSSQATDNLKKAMELIDALQKDNKSQSSESNLAKDDISISNDT